MLKEAWSLAIETMSWMEMQRLGERQALAKTVRQLDTKNPNAIRLAYMLVCETVRRQNFIDDFINAVIEPEEISKFNLGIRAFLRLYVYQTRMPRNWLRIDVEEAENIIKLARSILGWKTLREVEPILGVLLTRKPGIVFAGISDEKRIGLLTFHPTWFVKYCFKLFGRAETMGMLQANLHDQPTYLRLNTLRDNQDKILGKLAEEGVKVEKVQQLRYTYKVTSVKIPLIRTESFKEGLFYIQDKASCFAAEAADPRPEMTLLDICAAPGAKTTYLAQLMQNRGVIYSVDYSKRRMQDWKDQVTHMDADIAEPVIADARSPLPLKEEADVLVLDPPCTGTGTFAKLPSGKWRLTRRSVDNMAEIQCRMLDNCAQSVKPNGTLIYSTCSITVEENEMLIERFLKQHQEFSFAEITPKIGLSGLRGLDKCRRLFPHIHECNGFFIARMLKNAG